MDPHESTRLGPAETRDDKHPKLNTFLDGIRDAGMKVTNTWKDMWLTAIRYAWGWHYEGWKLKDEWDYVVVNRIYPLMFQTIAKLAGNDPKILTHAWDDEKPEATEYAEKWAGHLDYLWKSPYELNMRLKLIRGLLDCAVFGYMVGEPYWETKPRGGWDKTAKRWVGKAGMRFCHPALFWCDPSADTVDNAENCGMKRRVKLEWALNKWPEYEAEIEAEAFTSSDREYTAGDNISIRNQKAESLTESTRNMFSKLVGLILRSSGVTGEGTQEEQTSDQKYVWLEKIFWRDYEERTIKLEDNVPEEVLLQQGVIVKEQITGLFIDPKTGKPLEDWPTQVTDEYKEPLYPNGRFVLRIGKTILNPDTKDQVYTESRWPFIIMPYHVLPHMWQGGNAVEMAKNNNDMLNMTVSAMVQQVRRSADPTKIVEAGALAKDRKGKIRSQRSHIFSLGRLIIAARGKGDKIRDWDHQPLDPAVIALAAALKQDIDDQSFMQDIARGAKAPGTGQQTKAEIERLNKSSLDYVALQGIFLDKFIDDTMTLIAELCQRNYDPGKLLKMLQDQEKQAVKIDQPMLDVRFDVNIEPGSTLPFDEQKKQLEYKAAYDLLENPVPNPMIEDMMRVLSISKRKEILARYQGLILFRQFIQIGAMLIEAQQNPEKEGSKGQEGPDQQQVQQQVMQLLIQAGQLAPQAKV